MELIDVVKSRRAVREYTADPVDRATVERLIDAAILAPSAMNLQFWAFAVLLGRERIEGYAKRARDWLLASLSQTSYEPSIRRSSKTPNLFCFITPCTCKRLGHVLRPAGCRGLLPRSRKPDIGCSE